MAVMNDRAAAKRLRILEAASGVFRRHGFARASLDLVAADAGMSRPALYNFFASKEVLFEETVLFMGSAATALLREGASAIENPAERLAFVCREWAIGGYDRTQSNPDATDLIDPSLAPIQRVYTMVEDLLAGILVDGWPHLDADGRDRLLARNLIASMKGFKDFAQSRDQLAELLQLQIDLVLGAIAAPRR
jgi:AcrR family transcriptional regulator